LLTSHFALGQATDEQLLAEIARRKLDIHGNITMDMVKSSYQFEDRPLGHGASGEGIFQLIISLSNF
jgi:hypothetical protein